MNDMYSSITSFSMTTTYCFLFWLLLREGFGILIVVAVPAIVIFFLMILQVAFMNSLIGQVQRLMRNKQ